MILFFNLKEKPMPTETEPARIVSLFNAALGLSIAAIAYALDWSAEAVVILTGLFAAWVAVGGELIRARVTPNASVAMTTDGTRVNPLDNP